MNLKSSMVLIFVAVFMLAKGCEMSFPRGEAQAQDCIPIIEGKARITSITTYDRSGDIFQLGLYLEVAKVPDNLASFHILLDIPPNHLKPRALQEALSKHDTLFIRYREKTCAGEKYDKILKISVQTMKGMEDITVSFLTESAFKEATRTGLKK